MRSVTLTDVLIEDFMSYKSAKISLGTGPGFKFLGGRNELEPRLGPNGAGKSSFWAAVAFCFYGTDAAGSKASELTAWHSKKARVVCSLIYDEGSGPENITIERTSNPNRIVVTMITNDGEIVGRPTDQAALTRMLGLSPDQFFQAVFFGQGATLFVEKSVPERGELFDEILDLKLWVVAAAKAAEAEKTLERQASLAENELARLSGFLEGMGEEKTLKQLADAHDADSQAAIDNAISNVERIEAEIAEDQASLARLLPTSTDTRALERLTISIRELHGTRAIRGRELNEIKEKVEFYQHEETCPECKQRIHKDFKEGTLKNLKDQEAATILDIEKIDDATTRSVNEHQRLQAEADRAREANMVGRSLQSQIGVRAAELEHAVHAAEQLAKAGDRNPHREALTALRQRRDETAAALAATRKKADLIALKLAQAVFWKQGFKRLRLFIVDRAIDLLTIETRNAAEALGLVGWEIIYATEKETKAGTSRPGIYINVKSPSSDETPLVLYSGGEGQRVKLAVSIGMSSMIQRMAGVSFKFEVWDEPTSGLSAEGIADLVDCLRGRAHDGAGKSIWFVDQHMLSTANFDEVWIARKNEKGSQLLLEYKQEGE